MVQCTQDFCNEDVQYLQNKTSLAQDIHNDKI